MDTYKAQICVLLSNIEKVNNEILKLREQEHTGPGIIEKIESNKAIIMENETNRDKFSTLLQKIDLFLQYQNALDIWEKAKLQVDQLTKEEKDCRDNYSATMTLKDKILEAESIAILNIINTINTHVQLYLEHFFPDNPITVLITAFKETKSNDNKPQINLEIDYKGIEHDLSMLSGGELSRVILAFTLALAEIQNSPLLLLDECTSSLDQELTASVIEGLKENFGEKLVLLIAHQVVQGTFDNIVRL